MIEFSDSNWMAEYFFNEIPDLENFLDAINEKIRCMPFTTRFNDREIDLIYSLAYSFFQQGKLEIAQSLFNLLVFYRPSDQKILNALAITCKKNGDYELACLNFVLLLMLNPGELRYAQHLAECLSANGEKRLAFEAVESILKSPLINLPENKEIAARSEIFKELLEQNNESKENIH
jgi:tetratricopeptide (TPR) repeat protein